MLSLVGCRYVNQNRELTKQYVLNLERRGSKALFVTVDAPQLGRREKDIRAKNAEDGGTEAGAKVQAGQTVEKGEGHTRAISVSVFFGVFYGCLKQAL